MPSRSQFLITIFLIFQIMSVPYLWSLGTTDIVSQGEFAIYLALNLISFSMIAYIYRKDRLGERIGTGWMLAGCAMLLALIYSSLLLTLV